jgi:hypothetical protein
MTDVQRDIMHQRISDAVAAVSAPASAALWLSDIDVILRILVSAGSLVLIGFAIWAKIKQARRQ